MTKLTLESGVWFPECQSAVNPCVKVRAKVGKGPVRSLLPPGGGMLRPVIPFVNLDQSITRELIVWQKFQKNYYFCLKGLRGKSPFLESDIQNTCIEMAFALKNQTEQARDICVP